MAYVPRRRSRWLQLFWAIFFYGVLLLTFWRFGTDFENHGYRYLLIIGGVVLFNGFYGEGLRKMGFWPSSFKTCFLKYGSLLFILFLYGLAIGVLFGTPRYDHPIEWLVNFLKYLAAGFVQQYLLNGFFVNRFGGFLENDKNSAVCLVVGSLFALMVMPNWFSVVVTFFAYWVCSRIFLNSKNGRNLYFLGLAHGMIGFLLLAFVPDGISRGMSIGFWYF